MDNIEKAGKRIVFILLASQSLFSAALILTFTIASIVAVDLAGGNSQWTGIPSTLGLIGAAAFAYPVGWLMDRAGRRAGLSVGYVVGVAGAALSGWGVVQKSLVIFLAGALFLGLAQGAIELARYAAAEARPPDRRGRAISLVVLGGTVGSIVGPSLVALSESLAGPLNVPAESTPWLIVGFLLAVALVVTFALLRPDPRQIAPYYESDAPARPDQPERGRPLRVVLQDPRARLAVAAMTFGQLSMVVVMTVTPVYMHGHQHALGAISLVIMAHTLGMFGLSYVTGWLVDRVGRASMILAGGLILGVACVIAPFSLEVPWLAIALFLLGLGWNFTYVAGSTLLDDLLPANEKGRMQGSADAIVRLASGAGSLGSGFIFAATSFTVTSWITIVFALVPVALVVLLNLAGRRVPVGGAISG